MKPPPVVCAGSPDEAMIALENTAAGREGTDGFRSGSDWLVPFGNEVRPSIETAVLKADHAA